MVLHILFNDGSNPYVFFSRKDTAEQNKKAIVRDFAKWKKAGYFPREIFSVLVGAFVIEHDNDGTWYIRHDRSKQYKHLGHAINKAISLQEKRIS